MNLSIVAEVWNTCKYSIDGEDIDDIAERVVGILIDHNYELDAIKDHFSGDSAILTAVKYYSREYSQVDDDSYDDYDDDDDYDDSVDEFDNLRNSDDY